MSSIDFYGGYQVYSESGVDLTLLRENMKRPETERLLRNENAARFCRELDRVNQHMPPPGIGNAAMAMDTQALLRQLVTNNVNYVLIGGLAMRAQGSAHITDDFDICYERSDTNLDALVTAIDPLHPYLRGAPPGLPFRFDVPTLKAGLNFTLNTDLGDVDLLGEVRGLGFFKEVLAQSEPKVLFEFTVHVLTLDGLIASKTAAGRLKDRNHLLELEELKKLRHD
jgi:hypothetical protein